MVVPSITPVVKVLVSSSTPVYCFQTPISLVVLIGPVTGDAAVVPDNGTNAPPLVPPVIVTVTTVPDIDELTELPTKFKPVAFDVISPPSS